MRMTDKVHRRVIQATVGPSKVAPSYKGGLDTGGGIDGSTNVCRVLSSIVIMVCLGVGARLSILEVVLLFLWPCCSYDAVVPMMPLFTPPRCPIPIAIHSAYPGWFSRTENRQVVTLIGLCGFHNTIHLVYLARNPGASKNKVRNKTLVSVCVCFFTPDRLCPVIPFILLSYLGDDTVKGRFHIHKSPKDQEKKR